MLQEMYFMPFKISNLVMEAGSSRAIKLSVIYAAGFGRLGYPFSVGFRSAKPLTSMWDLSYFEGEF